MNTRDVLLTLKNRERQGYRGCTPVNTSDVLLTLKSRERQGHRGCVYQWTKEMCTKEQREEMQCCVPVSTRDWDWRAERDEATGDTYQSNPETCCWDCTVKTRERQGYRGCVSVNILTLHQHIQIHAVITLNFHLIYTIITCRLSSWCMEMANALWQNFYVCMHSQCEAHARPRSGPAWH